MFITVLIPAHNEADQLPFTLASLQKQTLVPNRVIVMSDNSTDNTVHLTRELGFEAWESVNNTQKKAGALNQALDLLLDDMKSDDRLLIMDADTQLAPEFIEVAVRTLLQKQTIAAVGAVFYGDTGGGLLGLLQRNEYARYGREIEQTGKVQVLSGTAAMFKPGPLREVADARSTVIPGEHGKVYDTLALTEDNELTFALKTLGWELRSPMECTTVTEIMPTLSDLWKQRVRWYRGALENLKHYGLRRAVAGYWYQQAMLGFGIIALYLYLSLTFVALLQFHTFQVSWFWMGITGIFVAERMVTVWRAGWKSRLVAAPLYIELAYDMILQAAWLWAACATLLRLKAQWVHVTKTPVKEAV